MDLRRRESAIAAHTEQVLAARRDGAQPVRGAEGEEPGTVTASTSSAAPASEAETTTPSSRGSSRGARTTDEQGHR